MPVVNDYTALLGGTWNQSGRIGPLFLTYSMSTSVPPEYVEDTFGPGTPRLLYPETTATFSPFDAAQQNIIRQAFQIWGAACGITFAEVSSNTGDIQLGQYSFASDPGFFSGAAGLGYFPSRSFGLASTEDQVGGDVLFNTGSLSLGLALHEIGHALGLKHPFEGATTLAAALDSTSNTVMSYTGGLQSQLGQLDINAVQWLYGTDAADGAQAPGGWSWNAALEQFTINGNSAGNTLEGAGSNDIINGLGGDDILVGWSGNDRLNGGLGNDRLLGGDGDDTFIGGAGDDEFRGGDRTPTSVNGVTQPIPSYYIGFDTADYSQDTAGILVDIGVGRTSAGRTFHASGPAIGLDYFDNIEKVIGGSAADFISGSATAETFLGGAGADELVGRGGNDTLIGDGAVLMTEHAQSVNRLYLATLARAADDGGLADWTAQHDAGATLATIATGFVNSQEFLTRYGPSLTATQFVTLLYNNVLHRAPDAGGLANWVGALNGGASRESVVVGFSDSGEFVVSSDSTVHAGQVYRLYGATLARQPDAGGFADWVAHLDGVGYASQGLGDVTNGFVGSTEFQNTYGALSNSAFVELLYNNVLHRASDSGGLANWVGQLNGGTSRAAVVNGFSESGEYINSTNPALRTYMQTVQPTWNDIIDGGTGNDSVSGGHGADTFKFAQTAPGADEVYGFERWDTLQLFGYGYANVAAAQSHLTQSGDNLVFADQGVSVTFHHATLADLQAANWLVT
jgi:Ca2+-binding RTX toxin-like protein